MEAQLKTKRQLSELRTARNGSVAKVRSSASARHMDRIVAREKKHLSDLIANSTIITSKIGPYFVTPVRIGPEELVENRPAWIEFEVWNRTETLTDVFVRARIEPRQSVESYRGSFDFALAKIESGKRVNGAISFQLPRADVANKVILELIQLGDIPNGGEFPVERILTSAEMEFDVGAKFSVQFSGIWIRDTASIHEDTLFVSLNGQFGNASWGDSEGMGDQNNTGSDPLVPKLLPVGPFFMIPGSGSAIAVSCVVANAGHTSAEEDAKRALKTVSLIGAQVATAVMSVIFPIGAPVWAGLSEGANQLHQAIIDWALADCDTVVLNEGKLCSEHELFLFTHDQNDNISTVSPASWVFNQKKKAGVMIADYLGGGCRDSDYSAALSLSRHRAPEMVHDYRLDGVRLSKDQVANFGHVGIMGEKITYEFAGGDERAKLDTRGNFKAPSIPSDHKFSILKWTVYTENKNGIFPVYDDFSLIVLD